MDKLMPFGTIRGRLNIMMIVPIVLFIGIELVLVSLIFQYTFAERVSDTQMEALRRQEQFIDRWISERSQDVHQLALNTDVRDQHPADAFETFEALINSQDEIYTVAYVGMDGIIEYDHINPPGLDVADRGYFRTAVGGRSAMSEVIIGRTSGNKIFIFAEPVRDRESSAIAGVIFAPVLASVIDEVMDDLDESSDGETYLLDNSGTMITQSDYEPRLRAAGQLGAGSSVMTYRNESEIVARARAMSTDSSPYTSYAGIRVIGSYRWIKGDTWLLVSEQPVASAFAPARRLQYVVTGISFFFVLVSLLIIRSGAQSIAIPVQELAKMSSHFLDSKTELQLDQFLYQRAPIELKTLSDSLHAMGTRIRNNMVSLSRSSLTDSLTGIHNRAYLAQEGVRFLKTGARNGHPCAAIMLDIDHFKSINDEFGHAAGDDALRTVASIISNAVRESDIVVRYGGEEFIVLVSNSTLSQARELAERIRTTAQETVIDFRSVKIVLTMSGGVSMITFDGSSTVGPESDDLAALISRADDALYDAKRSGRNRIRPAGDA